MPTQPIARSRSAPAAGRRPHDRGQRGSIMLVAMVVLVALLGLASLTVVNVKSGLTAAGHERFRTIALYSAESGVAAASDFLRKNIDAVIFWSAYVSPDNANPQAPTGLPGTGVMPGETGALLSADLLAWYEVVVLNNPGDPGLAAGEDQDARVIVRSTGHGPNGTIVVLEVELRSQGSPPPGRPCPSYAQEGLAEDGAGRNDCLSVVEGTVMATFRPGG